MPYKDPEVKREKHKAYTKKWYEKNKEKIKERIYKNKRKSREKWHEFKASLSCTHCGFAHPAAIDFHHVVRDGTKENINTLLANGSYTRAYEETKKCIPLCANCHRILHWNEHPGRIPN